MSEPVLVIMAAGMGSRYGGLKQMDAMDAEGHLIVDFSIYDAVKAGFKEVVFIIKQENEQLFREKIDDRISKYVKVRYVHQNLYDLPEGYEVPEGRVKPWGTGHAILSCILSIVGQPFAVINADDYYGREAFELVYRYLTTHSDDEDKYHYAMVAYQIMNTVTENGYVSRGVCTMDGQQKLTGVTERTHIEKRGDHAEYTEDDGQTWHALPTDAVVSMNLWGFSSSILDELLAGFAPFLDQGLKENPLKCEYFLPSVVNDLIARDRADVEVLTTHDKWYGVTYKEDKPVVVEAIARMKAEGLYPEKLWD